MEKDYYTNIINLVKIAQYLKGREVIFMNAEGLVFRNINVENAFILKKQIDHFGLVRNKMNIYHSIARYSKTPMFSWNQTKRKQQYKDWNDKEYYKKFINGYSFYLDFDNTGDYELTKAETETVSDYLTKKGYGHQVIFSGKGFHISSETKEQSPEGNQKIMWHLKALFMLSTLDESIYKWQSIIKTPYTIDFKTGNICQPIDIKNFDKEEVKLK